MRLTASLSAVLLLAAVSASAADLAKLDVLQGDWTVGKGSVFTVSGSSGRLSKVSAADRKAGYADGEILVQGLTYRGNIELNNGDIRARFTGTCRSPTIAAGKVQWVVSDCELRLVLPAKLGSDYRLSTQNGSPLIASSRSPGGRSTASAPTAPTQSVALPSPTAAPAPPAPEDPNNSWARRNMDPAELAAQDEATARANAAISANNAAVEARNRKAAADHAAAEAARAAKIRADQEAHDAEMAAYRARVAAVEAANARARAQWEADVAACKAGDRTRCAAPK
jgi:pyruvate/2-oxoglutarate dehydrogenase complex dihydrolipoamide acyltransferase (E2) component